MFDGPDTIGGQWVGPDVGVLVGRTEQFLTFQNLKKLKRTAGRLFGRVEQLERRLVGRGFLTAAVAEEIPHRHRLAAGSDRRADVTAACRNRRGTAENEAEDGGSRALGDRIMHAGQMAAGDVTGFVGEHADDLRGVSTLHDETGVDEKILPAGDEGVEGIVLDDIYVDRVLVQTGGREQGGGKGPYGILGFRITDHR